jgi:hypothetical protein
MSLSDRFLKQLRHLKKDNPNISDENAIESIHDIFVSTLSYYPSSLVEDLFSEFYLQWNKKGTTPFQAAHFWTNYIDLLEENYNEEEDPFTKEDWLNIKEIVSESGIELDESLLTYIMALVVDRGLI